MKENIEAMRQQLNQMEALVKQQEAEEYKNRPHKAFAKGDFVTKGDSMGKVEWTENLICNCPEKDGYMAVDLLTGNRGLACFEKRDEWDLVDSQAYSYLTQSHTKEVKLSGEEIELIRYYLKCTNGYQTPAVLSLLRQLSPRY